jgi:hypothetical protein
MMRQTPATMPEHCAGATRRQPALATIRCARRPSTVCLLALLIGAGWLGSCSDNNGGGKKKPAEKRMLLSTGDFNRGYQDGKRDATAALMDANGSWMWGWVKGKEYTQGYDQGWSDGRQIKELQSKVESAQKQEEKQQPPPEPEQSSKADTRPPRNSRPFVTVDTKAKGQQ